MNFDHEFFKKNCKDSVSENHIGDFWCDSNLPSMMIKKVIHEMILKITITSFFLIRQVI